MNRHILEWYKDLPEPYRSQAIENYDPGFYRTQTDHLASAIQDGFEWRRSIQGHDYWSLVFMKIRTNTLLPSYNKYLKNA